jgi:hypothetical protein
VLITSKKSGNWAYFSKNDNIVFFSAQNFIKFYEYEMEKFAAKKETRQFFAPKSNYCRISQSALQIWNSALWLFKQHQL